MSHPGDLVENRYLFGDGSKNNSKRKVINHTYNGVCNCITEVYVIAKEGLYYYYAKDIQNISVIGKD